MSKLRYNPDRLKPGTVFYSAIADYDDEEGTAFLDLDEWHVRSIRAKRGSKTRYGVRITNPFIDTRSQVNLVQKTEFTWVKRSKRHGDFGWSDNIPSYYRRQFALGESLPPYLFSTPLQALKYARAGVEKDVEKSWLSRENADKVLRLVKSRITRLRNKKQARIENMRVAATE